MNCFIVSFLVLTISLICFVYAESKYGSVESYGQDSSSDFDKQESSDLNSIDTSSWDKKSSKKGKGKGSRTKNI